MNSIEVFPGQEMVGGGVEGTKGQQTEKNQVNDSQKNLPFF